VLSAVRSHGGALHAGAQAGQWLAHFPQPQAAVGAAHQVHRQARREGVLARIAILPGGDPRRLLLQAAAVAPGETWVAAEIAAGLILTLDGDVEDLGPQHDAETDEATRIFRVSAPPNDGPAGVTPARGDLRPTVAVVPFRPYAFTGEALHLGDVVVDQVIAALSRSHAIHVISRLSTQPFRDRESSV
jgi:hypothetical protein